METLKISRLFKINQFILYLCCAYIGILFAGRADYYAWVFITITVLSGKVVQVSFRKLFDNRDGKKSIRYSERMIPDGRIKPVKLWLSGIFFSGIMIGSAFLLNQLCYLITIGAAGLLFFVPLFKRFTSIPDHYLGLFESVCLAGGFIAANGRYEFLAVILAASVLLWSIGIEFSLAVFELIRDRERKIFSFPVIIGINKTFLIIIVLFILSVSGFIFSGIYEKRGLAFWIGIVCGIIILLRQVTLLKNRDPETAKKELIQINNLFIPAIFIGTIIDVFF